MRRARWIPVFAAAVALLAQAGQAPASSTVTTFFRTPSGNIGCVYMKEGSRADYLRCDVGSGLRPLPPRPRGCEFDWGIGFNMAPRGPAKVTCGSDSVLSPSTRVLRYGSTWRRGPFTCSSRRSGLRCTNASRRGFFLSRQRSYRF